MTHKPSLTNLPVYDIPGTPPYLHPCYTSHNSKTKNKKFSDIIACPFLPTQNNWACSSELCHMVSINCHEVKLKFSKKNLI